MKKWILLLTWLVLASAPAHCDSWLNQNQGLLNNVANQMGANMGKASLTSAIQKRYANRLTACNIYLGKANQAEYSASQTTPGTEYGVYYLVMAQTQHQEYRSCVQDVKLDMMMDIYLQMGEY